MQEVVLTSDTSKISVPAARLAIGAAVAVILLLASLHALSPEFDPSWRVISEYALGQYGWVLSLMSIVLFAATMVILIVTYTRAGGNMTAEGNTIVKTLPPGVIAVNGWANRLLLVISSVWVITVAWQAIKVRSQKPSFKVGEET